MTERVELSDAVCHVSEDNRLPDARPRHEAAHLAAPDAADRFVQLREPEIHAPACRRFDVLGYSGGPLRPSVQPLDGSRCRREQGAEILDAVAGEVVGHVALWPDVWERHDAR